MIYENLYRGNGKTYFAIPKNRPNGGKKPITKNEAIRIANKHFKVKLEALEVVSGKIDDNGTLLVGSRGDWWVVYRR